MVEDKIIIHEKKIDYILFMIGLAFLVLSITTFMGFYLLNLVTSPFIEDNFSYEFIKFINSYAGAITIFSWCLKIPAYIIMFIALRKILINKKFSILVFVLLLVHVVVYFIGRFFANMSSLDNVFYTICNVIELVVLIFMFLIINKNKILSKLLIVSMVLCCIEIVIGIFTPFVHSLIIDLMYMNNGKIDLSTSLAALNLTNLIGSYMGLIGLILIIIYLIRAIIKNNIFKKPFLNKLIPTLLMVIPTLIVNLFTYIIYLVCFSILIAA